MSKCTNPDCDGKYIIKDNDCGFPCPICTEYNLLKELDKIPEVQRVKQNGRF